MLKRLMMSMVGCFVPLRRGQLEGRTNILSRGKQTALFLLTLIMCLFLQVQPSWSATTLYGSFAGGGIWQWNGLNWTQATPNDPTIMAATDLSQYGNWTWVSGSNTGGQAGSYGTKGVAAADNVPGARGDSVSWTDSSGNLWIFGGYCDSVAYSGNLNDLWRYQP